MCFLLELAAVGVGAGRPWRNVAGQRVSLMALGPTGWPRGGMGQGGQPRSLGPSSQYRSPPFLLHAGSLGCSGGGSLSGGQGQEVAACLGGGLRLSAPHRQCTLAAEYVAGLVMPAPWYFRSAGSSPAATLPGFAASPVPSCEPGRVWNRVWPSFVRVAVGAGEPLPRTSLDAWAPRSRGARRALSVEGCGKLPMPRKWEDRDLVWAPQPPPLLQVPWASPEPSCALSRPRGLCRRSAWFQVGVRLSV